MNQMRFITAGALALATALLSGCAVYRSEVPAGEYLDDSLVTARAKAALVSAGFSAPLRFSVETQGGIVQLSGYSSSRLQMEQAVSVVGRVPGVKAVRNDIRVRD
jgi:osmotically-inducible protein OsmY